MKNKLFPIWILMVLFLSCSEDIPEFTNNWDEDVYYFGKDLKDKHVDLFFNISESEFDNDIQTLRENTGTFSEKKILVELSKIIGKIGDSHTRLAFESRLSVLPFRLLWLDDGLLLSEVETGKEEHLGKKIIQINETPIDEVLDRFRSVIAFENESNFKNQVVTYLLLADFYFELGISESPSEIKLNLEDGSEYLVQTQSTDRSSIATSTTPLFLQDMNTFYWYEKLTEDGILYIQYNACRERNDLSFQSFTDQIINEINSDNNIEDLVIDLRHNGGGNSSIMQPLIDELEGLVASNRFTKNEIHLIIGRKTFSSAILNTIQLKEKIDPGIYGEPSGGKPNHYGEVKTFQLRNSRLPVSYSTKYFMQSDSDEDSIYPDIVIEYNSEHFLNGTDPVLEKIIEK